MSLSVKVSITDAKVINKSYVIYTIKLNICLPSGINNEYKSQKRFSEFVQLKKDLEAEFKTEIPYEFPLKKLNIWGISSFCDGDFINERRQTLSAFLTDLMNDSFDVRWKKSHKLCDFLGLPYNWVDAVQAQKVNDGSNVKDSQDILHDVCKWLESIRDSKSQFEEAKKNGNYIKMMRIRLELGKLEKALQYIQQNRLVGEGEVSRRWIILNALKADLNRQSDILKFNQDSESSLNRFSTDIKTKLLDNVKEPHKPSIGRRKLGETSETISLNNCELLSLHKDKMRKQDEDLESLRDIIIKQKELSIIMNQELATQNEVLDMLVEDVNTTSNKLRMANISAKRFNERR